MKYVALRGVCVGIDQHLVAGDIADLDPATGKYLVSIKAVEEFKDEPVQPATTSDTETDKDETEKKKGKK